MPPGARGCEWRLLGYSQHPLEDLRAHASAFADPDFLAPLDFDHAAAKAMPEAFPPDTRYGFRVRVRPTVRTGKPRDAGEVTSDSVGDILESPAFSTERAPSGTGRAKERDAYQAAALPADGTGEKIDRGQVYADWLAGRFLAAGVVLETASLDAFRRTGLLNRDRSNGGKMTQSTEGPDATFTGTLRVADPTVFADGLARGIGRHRSFGFGMLLLAPANS